MSPKKDTQKSAKSTTANNKKSTGFTDEDKAAAKARVQELKAEARANKTKAIITASAPALWPKTWYGMPAYATEDGRVVCFFQTAQKFNTRYATLGFNDTANLDEGAMWPVAYALKKLTATEETRIRTLVKKAAS